jgi:hypothetical protein
LRIKTNLQRNYSYTHVQVVGRMQFEKEEILRIVKWINNDRKNTSRISAVQEGSQRYAVIA